MATPIVQSSPWTLVRAQHGVVSRAQLLALGFGPSAIRHRLVKGRLHLVRPGVYAVGRPELTRYGIWMAAVLACGPDAVLSHQSAAELWEIRPPTGNRVEVSVPTHLHRSGSGLLIHRRAVLNSTHCHGIPVTPPADTVIDLATRLTTNQLEAAINEADNHDLIDPDTLRHAAERAGRRRGAHAVRRTLDRATFTLTDSELERLFLPIARHAGLPKPETPHPPQIHPRPNQARTDRRPTDPHRRRRPPQRANSARARSATSSGSSSAMKWPESSRSSTDMSSAHRSQSPSRV